MVIETLYNHAHIKNDDLRHTSNKEHRRTCGLKLGVCKRKFINFTTNLPALNCSIYIWSTGARPGSRSLHNLMEIIGPTSDSQFYDWRTSVKFSVLSIFNQRFVKQKMCSWQGSSTLIHNLHLDHYLVYLVKQVNVNHLDFYRYCQGIATNRRGRQRCFAVADETNLSFNVKKKGRNGSTARAHTLWPFCTHKTFSTLLHK